MLTSRAQHGSDATPIAPHAATSRADTLPVTRIRPSRGWAPLALGELWHYRELLYFLVWRDVTVRYKQTALGAAWAVLQPVLTMAVFSVFFGTLARVPSDGVPYPIFSFAALVPWTFFAAGLTQGSNSLVGSTNLITKVYFPRLMLPLAAVLAAVVDFALALVVLLALMLATGSPPTAHALWLPLFAGLALLAALGAALWLSALTARFRDVRHAIPFLTQLWLFVTPVAYSSSLVPAPWRTLYSLNPMAGVVDGFRWALLGAPRVPTAALLASTLAALALLVSGALYFRRTERTFADVL